MMRKRWKNRKDRNAELVETSVLVVLDELLSNVPGASAAVAIVKAASSHRLEDRAEELLSAIAARIGLRDWKSAAQMLQQHIGTDWFDSIIEQGFRDVVEAVDPIAWRCIGFLVAEYIGEERKVDTAFRKAGAALRLGDEGTLKSLSQLTKMYMEIIAGAGNEDRVIVTSRNRPGQVAMIWMAVMDSDPCRLGGQASRPPNFEQSLRILASVGIGQYWRGLSDSCLKGNPTLRFEVSDDAAMEVLDTCLEGLILPSSN